MIPQALPAAAGPAATANEAAPQSGAASAFALLMQGTGNLQAGQGAQTPLQTALQTPSETADETALLIPEGIDPETPEGLMALLDHTITGLETSGAHFTTKDVVAAFAKALGAEPVASLSDLPILSELADPALEHALQEQITTALRGATPIGQLSMAAAAVPAVDRTQSAARPAEAVQSTNAPLAAPSPAAQTPDLQSQSAPRDLALAASAATNAAPLAPLQGDATATASAASLTNQPSAVPDAASRELPPSIGAAALPPELPRLSATPPPPPPTATPDEQLRHHVSQHIRSADTADAKFRFSLTPYGMGEIEIEIGRSETGRVQIAMTTETASVLNVLRQDRELLLDALQSRGISAENADLDFQTFGERGRQQQHQPGTAQLAELQELAETIEDPAPALRPATGSGLLDILT
ncbi:MAG: flagellar hook-length control protein FliK [Sulfitobacter sp.]